MRVLIVPYPGTLDLVGGHVTQQVETARALVRAGVDASVGTIDEALGGDADIVHAFGDIRPLLARGRPKGKLVVTPVYAPRRFALGPQPWRGGRAPLLYRRLRHELSLLRRPGRRGERVADFDASLAGWAQADLIVVNSEAEGNLLRHDAGWLPPLRVAHSGVSEEAFGGDVAEGRRLLGVADERFVLSVARVEPRKNHLSLALAVDGLPVRLALVGAVLPGNERYLEAIREVAPNVLHVPHIDHQLLRHVYAAAAVHALPSWYETTGLSTLEALAAGRPVVVAGGLCVEEYFTGCASFCDPAHITSIRAAVAAALEGPRGCEESVARRFSWDRTAHELLDAYADRSPLTHGL